MMALASAVILLGASAVPFLLIAAIIRGGLRARQERTAWKRRIREFD